MSLLRFDQTTNRGPTGKLWGGIVDWTKGINNLDDFVGRVDDFAPYLGDAVGISVSGDTGVEGTLQTDEPYGVVLYNADQAADAVTGFLVNYSVDLDVDADFKLFCMEVRLKVNDDDATTETFIGLTDEALDGFWGNDNTPDGSAIGVRWNADETLDLVSISATDTITVLSEAFATVERTVGFVNIGVKIENLDGTNYRVTGTIKSGTGTSAVVESGAATTSTIPGAAGMKPAVAHTNDNEAAPDIEVDWYAFVDKVVQ